MPMDSPDASVADSMDEELDSYFSSALRPSETSNLILPSRHSPDAISRTSINTNEPVPSTPPPVREVPFVNPDEWRSAKLQERDYHAPGNLKSILRRESCPANLDQLGSTTLSRSTSQPQLQRSDSGKSLSFHEKLERIVLFSSHDSPSEIGLVPQTEFIVGSESEDSDSSDTPSPIESAVTKRYPWRILHFTSPSTHRLSSGANIAVDYIRQEEDNLSKLAVSILIRNISFEKRITIRFTTDSWKTPPHESDALFVTTISSSTGGVVGIDKFVAYIDLDRESGQSPDGLFIEFAVRAEMGGSSFWDSNGGLNHRVRVKRMKKAPPSASATSGQTRSFAEANGMKRGKTEPIRPHRAQVASAEALARANAAVVAAEAVRIARDFEQQQKRLSADSLGTIAKQGSLSRSLSLPHSAVRPQSEPPVKSTSSTVVKISISTPATARPPATTTVRSAPPSLPPVVPQPTDASPRGVSLRQPKPAFTRNSLMPINEVPPLPLAAAAAEPAVHDTSTYRGYSTAPAAARGTRNSIDVMETTSLPNVTSRPFGVTGGAGGRGIAVDLDMSLTPPAWSLPSWIAGKVDSRGRIRSPSPLLDSP
ncbi:hypothetical protein HK405_006551 [Cladochytrium tenue]|nr:hypothetical protein HK405_006551 [Cladochytrium tenue]